MSPMKEDMVKEKEGQAILKYIKDNSYVIALAINGRQLSSEEFSDLIRTDILLSISDVMLSLALEPSSS